jgi:hypothetical protein
MYLWIEKHDLKCDKSIPQLDFMNQYELQFIFIIKINGGFMVEEDIENIRQNLFIGIIKP